MVTRAGPLATTSCEPRQARKGAAVAVDSGAGVWRAWAATIFSVGEQSGQGRMSYQVLARKWRPRTFSELVGQEHVLRALTNALDSDRLHHAYLFTGTRGVGKTTLGRILAKSLNCEQGVSSTPCGECTACREIDEGRFVDLLEVDAASRTKVEDTRELLEHVQYTPTRGRYKVYLIDEVHMLSAHSFNALLKTLEEPPPHAKFILATTDPQKLPVTILSRCLQFNLKCLSPEQIAQHLGEVLAAEGIEAEAMALKRLARAASGSMRDALSLLDQAIAFGGGKVLDADTRLMLGDLERRDVAGLLRALAADDGEALLAKIDELAAQGLDFNQVLAELIALLHAIAVAQVVPDWGGDDAEVAELAGQLAAEDVQLYYQIGLLGRRDLPMAPDPRTGFEMVMLRMLAFRPDSGTDAGGGTPPVAPVSRPGPEPAGRKAGPRPDPVRGGGQAEPAPSGRGQGGDWRQVAEALPVVGMTRQLAMNAVLAEWDGEHMRLLLPREHAALASANWVQRLQAALREYYQAPVQLQVDVGEPQAETPAAQHARQRQQRRQEAVSLLENDPNVRALKAAFDASLDPASVEYGNPGEGQTAGCAAARHGKTETG